MEESRVLKKRDALPSFLPSAVAIDAAVVSSVRRDLFRGKPKLRSKAVGLSAIDSSIGLAPFHL